MRRRCTLEVYRVHLAAQQTHQFADVTAAAAATENLCAGDAFSRCIAVTGRNHVVHQLHIRDLQSVETQRIFQTSDGHGAHEVDLYVFPFRQAETATLEILRRFDAGLRQGQDELYLVRPGQPQHAGVAAGGTCPDGGDIAAVAHRVLQGVVEVRFAHRLVVGFAQGFNDGVLREETFLQPAVLQGDAKAGGNGAARVPKGIEI